MTTEKDLKILTIDDEVVIRQNIAAYLEDSGFTVLQASNGRIGLEIFRAESPDLLLCDLHMPEMEGFEVLATISKEAPESPIIIVSGTGAIQTAIEATRLGAWDFILKPIQDMSVVEHAIHKAWERARLIKENRKYREHLEEEVHKRTLELEARTRELELANERLRNEIAERKLIEAELAAHRDNLEEMVAARTEELTQANNQLKEEIIQRQKVEQERERLHKDLIEASRQAGMAEVAISVVHNLGNALNSVNISALLIAEKIRESKVSSFPRVIKLLQKNADNLGDFLTQDEQGKQILTYLSKLSDYLTAEHNTTLEEINTLIDNIERSKAIIKTQRDYTNLSGRAETVALIELVEDAIKLNTNLIEPHGIWVERDYADVSAVTVDRYKMLQILVNLIKNGLESIIEKGPESGKLTLRIEKTEDNWVRLNVLDNGVGISKQNLPKIFTHGFSTKEDNYGFGLHNSANAAKELGGNLMAYSDGPDMGARFALEIPSSAHENIA